MNEYLIAKCMYMFLCMLFIKVGGTYTKPLLLPPEVAIGGFGRIQVHIPTYVHRY